MKRSHIEGALRRNRICSERVEEGIKELEAQRKKLLHIRGKLVLKADNAGYIVKGDRVTQPREE